MDVSYVRNTKHFHLANKVYVHKTFMSHIAFPSEKFPLPLLEILYLPPLRYLIQLYRTHQISVGLRKQTFWDEYGPTVHTYYKCVHK